jgi:chromosome segregation ATPase
MNNEEKILSLLESLVVSHRGLKEDVGILKEDVCILKEDVSILKEDVGILKEDVGILKEDVSILKDEVEDLQESNVSIRRILLKLENKHDDMLKALVDGQVVLEEHDRDHQRRISGLEDTVEKHTVELSGLRNAR